MAGGSGGQRRTKVTLEVVNPRRKLQDPRRKLQDTRHKIQTNTVHPVNGEVPPVKGRPWKLPHYANRGKTSSSGGELASARSCFSTVRTALGKLRITGLLARFDVARSFPQFPRPLLLQPTIWTSERGADLGSGRCQPRPHLPIYRMTHKYQAPNLKEPIEEFSQGSS